MKAPAGVPRGQWIMLGLVAAATPFSIAGAIYPGNTWLQVGPVWLGLMAAPWILRRFPLSDAAMGAITAFLLLHLFGATWSYSYVPYPEWISRVSGWDMHARFGWQRNMFDRLVHFIFGVLAVPVCAEVAVRHLGTSHRAGLCFALALVLAVSSVYEIFEWGLTMALAPGDAGAYNGEQGDGFDSQKDMVLAALGGCLALVWGARHLKRFEA